MLESDTRNSCPKCEGSVKFLRFLRKPLAKRTAELTFLTYCATYAL